MVSKKFSDSKKGYNLLQLVTSENRGIQISPNHGT